MPAYMKYGSIDGDVTTPPHERWIAVDSVQLGIARGGGHGIGKPSGHEVHQIVVSKDTDRASSRLFQESLTGKPAAVVLDLADSSGHVYLTFKLAETLISSYSVSETGQSSRETLTLDFSTIEYVKG